MNDGILFQDLIAPHREMGKELIAVVRKALQSVGFIGAPMLKILNESSRPTAIRNTA